MSASPEPRLDDGRLIFFSFDINLPDATVRHFGIYHDIAELLDLDHQDEAVAAFQREAGTRDPALHRRLDIDLEAGCAFIRARKPDPILLSALVINDLCVPTYQRHVDPDVEEELRGLLRSWKRPKPHRWTEGDVFAAPLCDGSFVHGQVLGVEYRAPTCALLAARSPAPATTTDEVSQKLVLSILHLGSDLLDRGEWIVIGREPPVADPDSGPCGARGAIGTVSYGGGRHLVNVAEAYYGLKPWNVGYCGDDDYFGKSIMPSIGRPDSAWIMSPEERARYRAERGITA